MLIRWQHQTAVVVVEDGRRQAIVTGIRITNPGRGYRAPPTITITGGGGMNAAAEATLGVAGNTEADNLYWARQTLYGKQLLLQLPEDEADA